MIKVYQALVIACLFVAGCGQQDGHEHADHETNSQQLDHAEKESYTLYSQNLELFVEFDPIVVSDPGSLGVGLADPDRGSTAG